MLAAGAVNSMTILLSSVNPEHSNGSANLLLQQPDPFLHLPRRGRIGLSYPGPIPLVNIGKF